MSATEGKFELGVVLENMKTSLENDDDVKLKEYLISYEELNKFFNLMGSVFGFVSSDLRAKMDILYEFLNDEANSSHFTTVRTMIQYEMSKDLLAKQSYVSGSRTLLRLHRGLDFIRLFLKRLSEMKEDDNTSQACKECYNSTLAKHHPFLVRNGAKLAMYAMPNRTDLFRKVCGDSDEEIRRTLETLPETLEATAKVYGRIEDLYTKHDLHSLP